MGQSHNQSHNITIKETVIKYIKTNHNIDVNTSKKITDFVNKNPLLILHTVHKIQNIGKGKYNADEASKALASMLVVNKVFDKKTFNLVIPLNLKPDRISKTLEFITSTSAVGTTITGGVPATIPNDNKQLGNAFERETKEKIEESSGKFANTVFKGAETAKAVNEIRKGVAQRIALNKVNKTINSDVSPQRQVLSSDISNKHTVLESLSLKTYKQQITSLLQEYNKISGKISAYQGTGIEAPIALQKALGSKKQEILDLYQKISGHPAKDFNSAVKELTIGSGVTKSDLQKAFNNGLQQEKQQIMQKTIALRKTLTSTGNTGTEISKNAINESKKAKSGILKSINANNKKPIGLLQKGIPKKTLLTNLSASIVSNVTDTVKKSIKQGSDKGSAFTRDTSEQISNVADMPNRALKAYHEARVATRASTRIASGSITVAKKIILTIKAIAHGLTATATALFSGPTTAAVLIVLLFLIIIISMFPGLLYSTLTIPSSDISINETIGYFSHLRANIHSKIERDYLLNNGITYPYDQLTKNGFVSDKVKGEDNKEHAGSVRKLWEYSYKDKKITINETRIAGEGYILVSISHPDCFDNYFPYRFDPMAYMAGVSSLYNVYGFPFLKAKIGNQNYCVPTGPSDGVSNAIRNTSVLPRSKWLLDPVYMYMICFEPLAGNKVYYDSMLKQVTDKGTLDTISYHWNNALEKYTATETDGFQHDWAYNRWWSRARDISLKLDLIGDIEHEAHIEQGAGFKHNMAIFEKIENDKGKLKDEWNNIMQGNDPDGGGGTIKDMYHEYAQAYNSSVSSIIDRLESIKGSLNSINSLARSAWAKSTSGEICQCGLQRVCVKSEVDEDCLRRCRRAEDDDCTKKCTHCLEWKWVVKGPEDTRCNGCNRCHCKPTTPYKDSPIYEQIENSIDEIEQCIENIKSTTGINNNGTVSNMSKLLDKECNAYFTTLTPSEYIPGNPREWFTAGALSDTDTIITQELAQLEKDEESISQAVEKISDKLSQIKSSVDSLQGLPASSCVCYHLVCPKDQGCHSEQCTPEVDCKSTIEEVESKKQSVDKIIDADMKKLLGVASSSKDMADNVGRLTYFLNCDIGAEDNDLIHVNDNTFRGIADNSDKLNALKKAYQKKFMAVYILNRLQQIYDNNKNSSDENIKAFANQTKEAIQQFVEIYNPYGLLFKQVLNGKTVDEYQSNNEKLVVYRDFGYYYNPFTFASTKSLNAPDKTDMPINPMWQPEEFAKCRLPKLEQLFTTAYYGGEVNQQGVKKGNLNRSKNWYDNAVMFRGCVIGTEKGLDGPAFKVYAPIGGEASIEKDESGNEFLVIYHKGSSELVNVNNNTRVLTDKLVLGGITLDPNIQNKINNKEEIGNGEYLGTAKMLYISYAQEDDLWHKWLFVFMKPKYIIYYIDPIYYMYCETGLPKFAP